MQINLFTYNKERNRINKVDYITNRFVMSGDLKDNTSVIRPVIRVEKTNPTAYGYNYMYIPDFGRYYFIDDIIQIRNKVWEIHASVDVLYSFMTDIYQNKCIIDKTENGSNANYYLNDGSFVTESRKYNEVLPFSNGLSLNGSYILICAGGNGGGAT